MKKWNDGLWATKNCYTWMNQIIFRFICTVAYIGYKIERNKNIQGFIDWIKIIEIFYIIKLLLHDEDIVKKKRSGFTDNRDWILF